MGEKEDARGWRHEMRSENEMKKNQRWADQDEESLFSLSPCLAGEEEGERKKNWRRKVEKIFLFPFILSFLLPVSWNKRNEGLRISRRHGGYEGAYVNSGADGVRRVL